MNNKEFYKKYVLLHNIALFSGIFLFYITNIHYDHF